MARTARIALALLLVAAPALAADVEFHMTADRPKVGTEDTFRLEIVVGNAPEGAMVQFPAPRDCEVLSRSESTQMSYSVGPGGAGVVKQLRKYTLVMRANRAGTVTIPPAVLQTPRTSYKTSPVTLEVVKGRLGPDPKAQRQANNPFGLPNFPGFPDLGDDDPFGPPTGVPTPDIPRSDSDLFLRSSLDKNEAYVGEQVMLNIVIYSRVDLSSVDTVTMPKLEGFWTQDIKSPSQLVPEQKELNGVPYRTYVLRQKALFAMKPGEISIEPAEADITTGFLFQGHRVHRKGNAVTLKVKPLPAGGNTTVVGQWRLSSEINQSEVTLGDPVQVKIVLEGKGNLQGVVLPKLEAPASIKVFDPQVSDRTTTTRNQLGGTRVVEYVLVPQQTGAFTIPGLSLPYFDPEAKRFDEARTDAFTLSVKPGAQGQQALTVPGVVQPSADVTKNQLIAGGLKSLRHSAKFEAASAPLWSRPFFVPVAAAPVLLTLLVGAVGLVRTALGRESPESLKKKQAKAARRRLAAAEKLLGKGSTADFYAEVERALTSFLEARLGQVVGGITRPELVQLMVAQKVPDTVRARIVAVFETCDLGRYAPGMGEAAARRRALEDAAAAMEEWA